MLHAILQSCNLLQKDHPSLNLNQFSRQPHQPKHAVQGSTTSLYRISDSLMTGGFHRYTIPTFLRVCCFLPFLYGPRGGWRVVAVVVMTPLFPTCPIPPGRSPLDSTVPQHIGRLVDAQTPLHGQWNRTTRYMPSITIFALTRSGKPGIKCQSLASAQSMYRSAGCQLDEASSM